MEERGRGPEAERSTPAFRIAIGAAACVVLIGIGLLITNLVVHFSNPESTVPVTAQVQRVDAIGSSSVLVEARVISRDAHASQVTCLVGIEEPGDPLAFPSKVILNLGGHQSKTFSVERHLIHPEAQSVSLADVALVCT